MGLLLLALVFLSVQGLGLLFFRFRVFRAFGVLWFEALAGHGVFPIVTFFFWGGGKSCHVRQAFCVGSGQGYSV